MLSVSNAQSIYFGVGGAGNTTWLINKNISSKENGEQGYSPRFGYNYGGHFGITVNKTFGIETGFLVAKYAQGYAGTVAGKNWDGTNHLETVDIPILLKLFTEAGSFFEFGIVYSNVKNAKYVADKSFDLQYADTVTKGFYSPTNIAATIGIGNMMKIYKYLHITPSIRLAYGITDLKGADGKGHSLNAPPYTSSKPTHTMSGGFLLALTYKIPFKD